MGRQKKHSEEWRDTVRESGLKPVYHVVREARKWADFVADDAASAVDSAEHEEDVPSIMPSSGFGLPSRVSG